MAMDVNTSEPTNVATHVYSGSNEEIIRECSKDIMSNDYNVQFNATHQLRKLSSIGIVGIVHSKPHINTYD